jgi:hypothetical protein
MASKETFNIWNTDSFGVLKDILTDNKASNKLNHAERGVVFIKRCF